MVEKVNYLPLWTSLEKLGLRGKITVIGIAKKLEEIYYPGDSRPDVPRQKIRNPPV